MIKKPPVLSEEDLTDIAWRIYPDKTNTPFIIQERKAVAQAQNDADVAYYEPLIKEMYEALGECLSAIDMFQKALKYSADCKAYSDARQARAKVEGNNAK